MALAHLHPSSNPRFLELPIKAIKPQFEMIHASSPSLKGIY